MATPLTSLGRGLVVGLFGEGFPFGQVVGALLFDVCLGVCSLCAHELLLNGILDPDGLDQLGEIGQMIAPVMCCGQQGKKEARALYKSHRHTIPWEGRP